MTNNNYCVGIHNFRYLNEKICQFGRNLAILTSFIMDKYFIFNLRGITNYIKMRL